MKKLCFIISILLLLLTGCAETSAQPYNIHLNCTADMARSISIVWQADTAAKQSILISTSDNSSEERIITAEKKTEDEFSVFSANISDLEPDTEYVYRIGTCEGSFRTAAEEGGFSFLFLGDPQPDTSLEASVEEQYRAWGQALEQSVGDTDFILLSGDLVNDAYEMNEWNLFFDAGKNIFNHKPFASAMGNHDKSSYYKLLMTYPSFPNAPKNMEDEYYSFDYQNVHFAVVNSNNIIDDEAYAWLEDDLSASAADFTIVMMHHSPYSATSFLRDESRAVKLRERFETMFLENSVDIVLVGHEHRYMRTKPLANEKIDENGIVYLMGVSGAKSYDGGANEYSDCFIINEQVYTVFNINSKELSMKTYTNAGEEMDSFTLFAD